MQFGRSTADGGIVVPGAADNDCTTSPLKPRSRKSAKYYVRGLGDMGRMFGHAATFNEDIADPSNYDLVINTGTLEINRAVEVIKTALA